MHLRRYSKQKVFAFEFPFYVEHVEVIERHAMPIASKHKETIGNDGAGVTVPGRWSLTRRLCQVLIIIILRKALLFSFQSFLLDQSVRLFEAGVGVLNQIGVPHRDRSGRREIWLKQTIMGSVISCACHSRLNLRLWLSLSCLGAQSHSILCVSSGASEARRLSLDLPWRIGAQFRLSFSET